MWVCKLWAVIFYVSYVFLISYPQSCSVCPMYELWHVWQIIWYIPLCVYLFSCWNCLFRICWIELLVRLVILCILGLCNVNVIHFLMECSLVIFSLSNLFLVCVLIFVIVGIGYPLVLAMCSMLSHSFCLYWRVRGRRCILDSRNLKAAILCLYGWLDVKCIIVFVVVVFLYISVLMSMLILWMRRSKSLWYHQFLVYR